MRGVRPHRETLTRPAVRNGPLRCSGGISWQCRVGQSPPIQAAAVPASEAPVAPPLQAPPLRPPDFLPLITRCWRRRRTPPCLQPPAAGTLCGWRRTARMRARRASGSPTPTRPTPWTSSAAAHRSSTCWIPPPTAAVWSAAGWRRWTTTRTRWSATGWAAGRGVAEGTTWWRPARLPGTNISGRPAVRSSDRLGLRERVGRAVVTVCVCLCACIYVRMCVWGGEGCLFTSMYASVEGRGGVYLPCTHVFVCLLAYMYVCGGGGGHVYMHVLKCVCVLGGGYVCKHVSICLHVCLCMLAHLCVCVCVLACVRVGGVLAYMHPFMRVCACLQTCTHACWSVCMLADMYTCMLECVHACIHVHWCVCACLNALCVCMVAYMYACVWVYMLAYMYASMCACLFVYMWVCACLHMCTQACVCMLADMYSQVCMCMFIGDCVCLFVECVYGGGGGGGDRTVATPSPGTSTSGIPMVRKRGQVLLGLMQKLLGMSVVSRQDWYGNCWGCQW